VLRNAEEDKWSNGMNLIKEISANLRGSSFKEAHGRITQEKSHAKKVKQAKMKGITAKV